MVIPSIYCCHSCVCSDNDFDVDFDYDSSDGENEPLIKKENNNYNINDYGKNYYNNGSNEEPRKKNTKKQAVNKKKQIKNNETIFYFYLKENDCDINKVNISIYTLIQYIKEMNIGTINKIHVKMNEKYKNSINKISLNNANYIRVNYSYIYRKNNKYLNKLVNNELIIALFINNPTKGQQFVTTSSINNTFKYNNNRVFYNIEHCYPCDYMFWMSSVKPLSNKEQFSDNDKSINASIPINNRNEIEERINSLPSSQPIDIPIPDNSRGVISVV